MKSWVKQGVVYQIYPRSFQDSNGDGIGDLQGIIQRLDYLQYLGVDMIWLSPIYESPLVDNGYDISNYYSILPEYGTIDDFKELVSALHERKIRLVMDLVINHTSDQHPWFLESQKSTNNQYRDFYHWHKGKASKKPSNWTGFFGGSVWEFDEKTNEYYLHLFAKEQPDLNWESEALRSEIKTMIKYWLDLGVDGFRCDVINLLSKNPGYPKGKLHILKGHEHFVNGPKIHQYLKELKEDVFDKYDSFTVGEAVFLTPEDALSFISFDNQLLTMVFQFDHMGIDNYYKWFLKRFKPRKLMDALTKWQNKINGKGWNSLYLENHDQPRSVSRFGDDASHHFSSATLLATILYFQQGTPFIYQGQEIGMTNPGFDVIGDYQDIETHRVYKLGRRLGFTHKRMMKKIKTMSRDNGRTPMQWDQTKEAGFTSGKPWIKLGPRFNQINVEQNIEDEGSILNYYKRLITLRKTHPIIVEGSFKELLPKHKTIYCYERIFEGKRLVVVANFSKKDQKMPLIKSITLQSNQIILQNYDNKTCKLLPYEARVYLINEV